MCELQRGYRQKGTSTVRFNRFQGPVRQLSVPVDLAVFGVAFLFELLHGHKELPEVCAKQRQRARARHTLPCPIVVRARQADGTEGQEEGAVSYTDEKLVCRRPV